PKKCNRKSSNGSCGVFKNVDTNWPVTGSGLTSPASFTSVPDTGSCATKYNATKLPNGLAFCAAKYTAPTNGFGNNGVCISTVATFDASGHDGTVSLDSATCSSEHANNHPHQQGSTPRPPATRQSCPSHPRVTDRSGSAPLPAARAPRPSNRSECYQP